MDMIWQGIHDAFSLTIQRDPAIVKAAILTLQVSLSAVLLATAIGLPLGAIVGNKNFWGRNIIVIFFRTGMGIPTVFVGLICFAMFSRQGPLGQFQLLYSPQAIAIGEFLLALPIIFSMTQGAVSSLDRRVADTAQALGAGPIRKLVTLISEARIGVVLGIFTALARCLTELGIAVMVGGNIANRTRTLATATALETSRGEFARGIAMGIILLSMSLSFTLFLAILTRKKNSEVTR